MATINRQEQLRLGIILTTLAITAWLFAQGLTRILGARLLGVEPVGASASSNSHPFMNAGSGAVRAAPPRDVAAYSLAILKRNMFDSSTGPQDQDPAVIAAQAAVDVPVDPNAPPPMCDGGLRLVAAIENARHPEWSYAAIAAAGASAQVYPVGLPLEGRELLEVKTNSVLLKNSGVRCRLQMFASGLAAPPPPAPVAAAPAESGADPLANVDPNSDGSVPGLSNEELDKGIQSTSEKSFNVSRSLMNKILGNQAALMQSARVVPASEGGRVIGAKLYGIRRNGLLRKLGLQNGDLMRTINGFDMTDPKSALEAYAKLRTADHITISVTRRGSPMNIDYNIR